jgi:glycerol-3-phosphate dehydrogenase (NAD(P)+)
VVGVIGAGNFGLTVANLLAEHEDVMLFTRRRSCADKVNGEHELKNISLHERIHATNDLADVCQKNRILFPIVPSAYFSSTLIAMQPYLTPAHILIHGTKGFDLKGISDKDFKEGNLPKENVRTMSEVIRAESSVIRVGCFSGPNLAKEILAGQPTATVIASEFDEVIELGKEKLSGKNFYVFGSHELKGAEIAGALKNIAALGSGMLEGYQLGRNMQAMLITRSLHETIYFGKRMGVNPRAFLGTAGIGDLIATCTSYKSRNFQFGIKLASGKTIAEIREESNEVAEGVRTLQIVYHLARKYKIEMLLTGILYKMVFDKLPLNRALAYLLKLPDSQDVDFV